MFPIGTIIKLILYVVIISVIAGGLWYVTNLKADLAVSEMNNQKLLDGIEDQQKLIQKMKDDIENIQKINTELNNQKEDLQKDKDALTSKFSKRDFGALASEKPEVVERLVNRGTINVMRCMELASGSPLNEKEKSAKTPTEANRECPSLINPAYTSPN
jgi:predicted Holliday junction resolvase-like endonuclease